MGIGDRRRTRLSAALVRFVETEAAGSVVLMATAAVALVLANTPAAPRWHALWHHDFVVGGGAHAVALSLGRVIDDALMAVFFLLVGLEIKRELTRGDLAGRKKALLPALAALGGMIVPAALYAVLNAHGPYLRGWGIPMATDIAFAVGVLSLRGASVPGSLTVFLTALAIVDDLGAVIVIALFYAGAIGGVWLGAAAIFLIALAAMARFGVARLWPYLVVGALLWAALLGSGVHATIAGVLLGFVIPAAPAERLESALERPVAFAILPLFALANAGVTIPFGALGAAFAHPVTLGVFVGLVAGKMLGVLGATVGAARLGWVERPAGTSGRQLLGGAWLAGIGFTMSIFIATLAFRGDDVLLDYAKIGIIAGSVTSALIGSLILRSAEPA